jgi:hypothetical protein
MTNNPIWRPRNGTRGLLILMEFSISHSKSKLYMRTHRPCGKILGGIIKNIKRNISYINNKLWEELIAYFSFTAILVSDRSTKKTLVYMRNEANKTTKFGRLQC